MNNKKNNSTSLKYELVNFCEFDKFAIKSYCAVHDVPENLNLGDITKIDETRLKPFNMICGGSPCQDFSVAGKQSGSKWKCDDCGEEYNPMTVHYSKRHMCPKCGGENLNKTRSSLLVEWLRIIRTNKPKWGIYENVKNIVGRQFKETFDLFIQELHEYGYNTYYKVLNAKDYGVPQNRERIYLLIILKEFDNGKFEFPNGFDNGKRLKDILEDEVDEKFYISDEKVAKIQKSNFNSTKTMIQKSDICQTLCARDFKDPKCVLVKASINMVGMLDIKGNEQNRRVYGTDGISPTLTTMQGGNTQPKIIINAESAEIRPKDRDYNKKGLPRNPQLEIFGDGINYASLAGRQSKIVEEYETGDIRVRKITPKESWRLMGFDDLDFEKAQASGVSNSQLYKQAGNSIVVDVLYYIFKNIYTAMPYLFNDLKVGSYFSGIGAFEKGLDRLYEDISSEQINTKN